MKFPRIFSYVSRMTRNAIFWHADELEDGDADIVEFMNWKAKQGLELVRPIDLVRMHARGVYRDEISSLFKRLSQYSQIIAFDERKQARKVRKNSKTSKP